MSAICELCFHHCKLEEGQTSLCRARTCRDGAVIPLNYGKLTSLDLDPIEKKPLRRFRPGSLILPGKHDFVRGKLRLQPALPLLPEP
jgi:pyruvate formate lyase activating enzyme